MYKSVNPSAISKYCNYYRSEFGERKYRKISYKINNSSKVDKLIALTNEANLVPSDKDYVYSIHEIPYFMFSRPETVALGALLALLRWCESCNHQFTLISQDEMDRIGTKIINECLMR